MRILIAEDETISRRMLESTLTKWGYEVVVAADGAEAWSVLENEDAPALAILDVMMPRMDGIEVCRKLRQLSPHVPVYVILLTAKSAKENVIFGLEAGADDYIAKPFHHDELRARIEVGTRVVELLSGRKDAPKSFLFFYLQALTKRVDTFLTRRFCGLSQEPSRSDSAGPNTQD